MTAPDPTHGLTLQGYLAASASRWPERSAVVSPDGSALTYAELDRLSDSIAAFLASRGIRPGDRVGLVLPKETTTVAAIFGILKAGAAYVPVDSSAPAERSRAILADCQVRAVFLDEGSAHLAAGGSFQPETIVRVDAGAANAAPDGSQRLWRWADIGARDLPLTPVRPAADDLAYILYTSGSTGMPKGVMLTQRNAVSFVEWCSSEFQPTEQDRFSSHAPFHFDLSILDLYLPLKHGATLVLVPDDLGRNPRALAEHIAAMRLTVWYSTPSILGLLAEFGHLDQVDCSALRLVLFAGEVFPVKHLRSLTARWPQAEYVNLYGPTETNVCTFARIPLPIPVDRVTPYPIGRPCTHCAALVLDQPDGRPVAPGQEGLLYISGPSVFQGYWNRPVENGTAFIERDGLRWYNTGDVVREDPDQGFIYLGRRDRMVKRRGYRIELGEIERALYQHPGVRDAAVVAVQTADAVRILAHLVAAGDTRPTIIDLKSFCARHLPGYMSPDAFVFLAALPKTSTGKTDYQALLRASEATPARSEASPAPAAGMAHGA